MQRLPGPPRRRCHGEAGTLDWRGLPTVEFTPHLARFFPDLETTRAEGATVAEVLASLERRHPGLRAYLVDERGSLRPHVNVFLGSRAVRDRRALSDAVAEDTRVFVFQALSGG